MIANYFVKVQQQARAKFGRFWYRFQNGESGADVYDRVGNFFGTLTRARQSYLFHL